MSRKRPVALIAGLAVGVLAVAAVLAAGRVPRGAGTVGADVTFIAGPTGELAIRSGPFVRGAGMAPGQEASGSVAVRNQTGRTLAVSLRALPSIRDLDTVLRVRVSVAGRGVYDGPLGGLRSWSSPFRLGSGKRTTLSVRVWLPEGPDTASRGRIDDVPLDFRSIAVGGAS